MSHNQHVRRIVILSLIAIVAIVGVAGFLFYRAASSASGESIDAALADFRAEPSTASPAAPGLPGAGVYELAVEGSETIGRSALSITRELPSAAPLIIRHTPTGFETESRYSDQHTEWVRYGLGADGASAIWAQTKVSAGTVGRTQPRDWTPPPLRLPRAPEVGQRWGGDYRSGSLEVTIANEVLREDAVAVGGESVPVMVIESIQTIAGEYDGERTELFWYSPETGLVPRYQIDSSLDGPVNLDFTVDQTLRSLTPLR